MRAPSRGRHRAGRAERRPCRVNRRFSVDARSASGRPRETDVRPTIVLVHGAWADGSSWQAVIPLLERDGYTVIAAQNPLTSLEEDVATTKRIIDAQAGSVVWSLAIR